MRAVTRRRERAGQAVGQRETAATARALPPPGRGPFADRRAQRSFLFRGRGGRARGGRGGRRSLPFANVRGGRGRRPSQPDVGQPFGQRRHDAQPVSGATAERTVVHADLVDEPVNQPGRAQVVRTLRARSARRSRQLLVRQLHRFFSRRHGHAQRSVVGREERRGDGAGGRRDGAGDGGGGRRCGGAECRGGGDCRAGGVGERHGGGGERPGGRGRQGGDHVVPGARLLPLHLVVVHPNVVVRPS